MLAKQPIDRPRMATVAAELARLSPELVGLPPAWGAQAQPPYGSTPAMPATAVTAATAADPGGGNPVSLQALSATSPPPAKRRPLPAGSQRGKSRRPARWPAVLAGLGLLVALAASYALVTTAHKPTQATPAPPARTPPRLTAALPLPPPLLTGSAMASARPSSEAPLAHHGAKVRPRPVKATAATKIADEEIPLFMRLKEPEGP